MRSGDRKMRAAGIEAFDGDVRMLELAEPGPPGEDEIVIAVRAAGVGNWDDIVRTGGWDVGRGPPLALGVEAAGVVVAVGDGVASLAPGDDVLTHPLPLRQQGAWAELLVAPAVPAGSLMALRERIASAPRCSWCGVPTLGADCTRCLPGIRA